MRISHIGICSYSILPHYLINGMIIGIKIIEHKMCFDFLYNFAKTCFITEEL